MAVKKTPAQLRAEAETLLKAAKEAEKEVIFEIGKKAIAFLEGKCTAEELKTTWEKMK